jgi:hypothetical protein
MISTDNVRGRGYVNYRSDDETLNVSRRQLEQFLHDQFNGRCREEHGLIAPLRTWTTGGVFPTNTIKLSKNKTMKNFEFWPFLQYLPKQRKFYLEILRQ